MQAKFTLKTKNCESERLQTSEQQKLAGNEVLLSKWRGNDCKISNLAGHQIESHYQTCKFPQNYLPMYFFLREILEHLVLHDMGVK